LSLSRRISEHRPTVILVVLVLLSLSLLATGTQGSLVHRSIRTVVSVAAYPFLKTLNMIGSTADYASELVIAYNASRKEAETARQKLANMMLRVAQRNELIQENKRLRAMIDFSREEASLNLEPVQVLESFKGIVVVDRGTLHGIRESMCAVSQDGIVGLVTHADPLSAGIVTLYHADCKVGAMIARNRVRGIVHGSSSELNPYCTMNYIDMKDDIQVGDSVVASPESIFPAGFPIGRVVAVHETGSLWKTADVAPVVDPYRLDEVFILRQALPGSDELAGRPKQEQVQDAQPNERSLQERYAP
jgi:rod shape-determining protein MreC